MALPVVPSPRVPKATLLKIVEVCSGVAVVWGTAKRPHLGQTTSEENAWIQLSLLSYSHVGVDERREELDVTNNINRCILVGQRQFTTSLMARSLDPEIEAFDLLERVAFRIRTATARELFGPLLALRDIQPITVLNDVTADNRIILAASMDIRWNSTVFADPNEAGEGGFVGNAGGSGTLFE